MCASTKNNSWKGSAIGLMDLDAFFASVEQLDHPDWRGKPVIVGGPASERGVVSTASYEARAFGVHSAMPSAQAERLCPQAIWTRGHFDRYRALSRQVMAVIADETPYVEQVSIDEAFFDITPGHYQGEEPKAVAKRIQNRISQLGISCSIGLGTSKTVAKIASEVNKPRGLTVVRPGNEEAFLNPLPVKAMSGIGGQSQRKLQSYGIKTLGQLASADAYLLRAVFGKNGELMRLRAQGKEVSDVAAIDAPDDVKSVSNERTFSHDLTDRADVDAALWLIGESVGRRLRKKELAGNTVTVKIKYAYGSQKTAQRRMLHPTDDENVFVPVALELMDTLWSEGSHARLLGLGLSGFENEGAFQTDFFSQVDEQGRETSDRRKLSATLDELRDKFGDQSVQFGRSTRFDHPMVRKPIK